MNKLDSMYKIVDNTNYKRNECILIDFDITGICPLYSYSDRVVSPFGR